MLLANDRIELAARPQPAQTAVLEVVLLGHYPDLKGKAPPHWERLAADASTLDEMAGLGLGSACTRLRELAAGAAVGEPTAQDKALMALYELPIPLHSFGQFQDLFPGAFDRDTHYTSLLGGQRAWLPLAVQDFFENALPDQALKLWVIRVDERLGSAGFLPRAEADMLEPRSLGPFERALLIPRAAILALPDLERLQIPAHLPDIPRLRVANAVPSFLPCGTDTDDDHRERRRRREIPPPTATLKAGDVLLPISRTLARLRPDMQCLLSVPLAALPGSELPGPDPDFLALADRLAGLDASGALDTAALGRATEAARHLQLLYPYLRGPDRRLGSAVGLVAGLQAAVTQQYGAWRSIAGRPLPGHSLPWPALSQHGATRLRQQPGVTVMLQRKGRTLVDDERLCAPCLPAVALRQLTRAQREDEHWRSAEVMRFMGWLRRELQTLGERMVFDTDPRDPRPQMALRSFFSRLHTLGALRGRRLDDAYTLTQQANDKDRLEFDIEIAPAFPIDRIRISFLQDRHSNGGTTTEIEVAHG